jgi:SAM-dependent methyltransferase
MKDASRESYGRRGMTWADRLGVWLSSRAIIRQIGNRKDLDVVEFGCGYRAGQLLAMGDRLKRGVGIDFQIAPELLSLPEYEFHQCSIEGAMPKLEFSSFDVVMLISVLEHLTDPLGTLQKAHSLLRPSGLLLINVPTWLGKFFLEFSAFHLALSPAIEMDDHKMYYNKRDLWPLLVRAGFRPSLIKLRYHKFGLNLFATARKSPDESGQ